VASSRATRALTAGLLLLAAALFAVGVAIERHDIHQEQAGRDQAAAKVASARAKASDRPAKSAAGKSGERAEHKSSSESSGAESAGEGSGEKSRSEQPASDESKGEGATGAEGGGPETNGHAGESAAEVRAEGSSEKIFGIDTESTPLVAAAVAVSVLLAICVWFGVGSVPLLLGVLGLGLVAAVFDVREAVHQSSEGRGTVEAIGIIVAVLHLAVAGLAAALLSQRLRRRPAPA